MMSFSQNMFLHFRVCLSVIALSTLEGQPMEKSPNWKVKVVSRVTGSIEKFMVTVVKFESYAP